MQVVARDTVVEQLCELGVRRGGVLLVHTAFSKVGPVEGGPRGLIEALSEVLGEGGTLVMPSMSYENDRVFEPERSGCPAMGVVADTFWRLPGVMRSDNPHAFAAMGPHADSITAAHPVDVPHGCDSPVGRVHALDGQVLLLGVGQDANTMIHLAENLASVRYRRAQWVTVRRAGQAVRLDYAEVDHCCARFELVDQWLGQRGLLTHGQVGHAQARLAEARDIVRVVVERLRDEPTVFLHTRGTCEECDDAWQSLERLDG